MRLTNNDLDMFNGEYGKAVQFAMKLIVKIGKIYQADDLIDVSSAHILGHYGSLHDAGVEFYEKLANLEAKCKIPTTVDPSSLPENWEEINIPNNYAEKQLRLYRAIQKIGVIQNWSCTPYEFANIPRYGEYIAWAESSAVVYANSVLGARTNRTPAGLDIAAAITGRMPRIGFYLD
ncbi:MAG: aconitase X, partial [Candidatus Heimdallarchaeaceae archaeon]